MIVAVQLFSFCAGACQHRLENSLCVFLVSLVLSHSLLFLFSFSILLPLPPFLSLYLSLSLLSLSLLSLSLSLSLSPFLSHSLSNKGIIVQVIGLVSAAVGKKG